MDDSSNLQGDLDNQRLIAEIYFEEKWSGYEDVAGPQGLVLGNRPAVELHRIPGTKVEDVISILNLFDTGLHA